MRSRGLRYNVKNSEGDLRVAQGRAVLGDGQREDGELDNSTGSPPDLLAREGAGCVAHIARAGKYGRGALHPANLSIYDATCSLQIKMSALRLRC